ncbi:MAG: 3-methyl-2-oxobutanoate dehydrogenase subunit VorB [Candidatus Omnitrophica bacterium]|nr:3-methyl-2-oxobutanoate dehydrogenase subunit VorB [Candidatus Omnitrophota bacterium]
MKVLTNGNEAIAEAAVQAGCRFYAGYPITPQNEIPGYFARRMPEVKGTFIQSESEIAAINMVFGAAVAGARCMTSSSGPGISLKQEGISYIAACQLPVVIVNMMRGGPGLGDVSPAQSDYFQATKGGGHGDYHMIVFAPEDVQEAYTLTFNAFNYADYYRNPVMILGDGILGQMMEPIEQVNPSFELPLPEKDYILDGCRGREARSMMSLFLREGELERHNAILQEKYKRIQEELCLVEMVDVDQSDVVIVAYGTVARICNTVMREASNEGIKVGLIRPITLWPFPAKQIYDKVKNNAKVLVVEMSAGQMLEDVKLALNGKANIDFLGRMGGGIPLVVDILKKVVSMKGDS